MTSQTPILIVRPHRPTTSISAGSQLIILLSASSLMIALMLSWAQLSQASPSPLSPSVQSKSPQQQQLEAVPAAEPASDAKSTQQQSIEQQQLADNKNGAKQATRPQNNVDKLKRGLANFMDQMNAAPFFVPQQPASGGGGGDSNSIAAPTRSKSGKSGGGGLQSASEPTALVSGDPSADALIKGPNRLAQTRPIGAPLRWGRR